MLINRTGFEYKRLFDKNIIAYLKLTNINYKYVQLKKRKVINNIQPLLQDDYVGEKDCSLVSLMTCIKYWTSFINLPISTFEIYAQVWRFAEKYHDNEHGTNNFALDKIYKEVLEYFTIKDPIVNFKYIKNIGYNTLMIKSLIDCGIPVILSMRDDGREFYHNHSVVVVGYEDYLLKHSPYDLNPSTKTKTMLLVYDNWVEEMSYVDPSKISLISSITF